VTLVPSHPDRTLGVYSVDTQRVQTETRSLTLIAGHVPETHVDWGLSDVSTRNAARTTFERQTVFTQ